MRGAAFLASLDSDISKQSALVVDIGGTTVCVLFPPFLGIVFIFPSLPKTDIGMVLFVLCFRALPASHLS